MRRPDDLPRDRRSVAAALGAIVLWSTVAVLGVRLRHLPPFFLTGCALLLGAVWGGRGVGLRGLRPAVLALGVYGLFAYHLCLFLALRLAPPVEANLVNYLWPLLIVVLAPALVPGARLRVRHLLGAGLGFAGAAQLLLVGPAAGAPKNRLAGLLLALAGAVIWSTYSLLSRRMGGFPPATIATFCAVSGALALVCHALLEPPVLPAAADLLLLLLMGLGPLGFAFQLWNRALRDGDPRLVGTLAYLTPLLSTLLVAAFGGGRLTATSALAAALIVGGAVVSGR